MSSYYIHYDAEGQYILCRLCGLISYNPEDVHQKYCGGCRLFHEDLQRTLDINFGDFDDELKEPPDDSE